MAFAIFAGMVSGSLIALRIEQSPLWLAIGVLAGGLVGYVSFDPLGVARGIRFAIKWSGCLAPRVRVGREEERPLRFDDLPMEWLRVGTPGFGLLVIRSVSWTLGLIVSSVSWAYVLVLFGLRLHQHGVATEVYCLFLLPPLLSFWATLLAFKCPTDLNLGTCENWFGWTNFLSPKNRYIESALIAMAVILVASPIGLLNSLSCLVSICSVFVARIVRKAFVLVHSHERVQAATYSALGTAIMWQTQASVIVVVVGSLVGALVGAFGHRYVSARFIKRPQTA